MALVKCLLNAVVSEDAHFGTLDIADCCLGADVPEDDMQRAAPQNVPRRP
jgi:hypothetical protein